MYQHGLGAPFLAKRPTERQHRIHTLVEELGSFAEAPEDVFQSLHYPNTFLGCSFEEFSRFMLSTLEGEQASKQKANRTLWSTIIKAGGGRREKRELDAGRAWYTSRWKLLMERLENDGSRVWAAKTRAAMIVWCG